jgi:hypothetical protein
MRRGPARGRVGPRRLELCGWRVLGSGGGVGDEGLGFRWSLAKSQGLRWRRRTLSVETQAPEWRPTKHTMIGGSYPGGTVDRCLKCTGRERACAREARADLDSARVDSLSAGKTGREGGHEGGGKGGWRGRGGGGRKKEEIMSKE